MQKSNWMKGMLFLSMVAVFSTACASKSAVKNVTAITEVFGDGQQVTALAVEYPKAVSSADLSTASFKVEGRTVTKVYANSSEAKATQGTDGRFVIVELSQIQTKNDGKRQGPPKDANGKSAFTPDAPLPSGKDARPQGSMASDKPDLHLSVVQTKAVKAIDGTTFDASKDTMMNSKFINLIVDDFKQLEFKDPATGETLAYNLYIPKNYDSTKSYPLVLFMHDASVTGRETTATLTQGVGATIWATPEEQAKHPCFVLAPQYPVQIVNDRSETNEYLDITVDLIHQIAKEYSIDTDKMYTTGQSGGCMMSIAIDIKYPDLFAASMLVAGQWDASLVDPLAKQKIWILVAEGDTKAFPGMNAITAALEKAGAKVSRATWNGRASAAEFAEDVNKMNAEGNNIRYSVFSKGTVFPEGQEGGMEHMQTWKVAYYVEGVRDWVFAQKK